jgi:hypothetical protein
MQQQRDVKIKYSTKIFHPRLINTKIMNQAVSIRPRKVRLVKRLACMEGHKRIQNVRRENLKGRDLLEHIGVDGRIILKCVKKWCENVE